MLLLVSCGSNRATDSSDNRSKYEEIRELVESREFQVEHEWALPLGGGNINLIGNPNSIRFQKDSIDLFLPYFGVRHMGGGYNTEGGLKYIGPVKNLEIVENENRNIEISFETTQDNENLDFRIMVYSNGNAHTTVNSSQRNSISYRGDIVDLPEKFKKEN
ncbi:hypothetical protein GCM10007103_10500 [Salinimicrobium marinum]|uniref:DUF4251 domain-containing protein n=2 Tax=Salinimicrobium marinum TaxID=680283 RepID=A0A918S9U7_9FLAO|nr:hypothetical protein GCM10007103_10500 [Salinimicrobium marinum]